MIREQLAEKIQLVVQTLVESGTFPSAPTAEIEIAEPKQADHGDFTCNFAMVASKALGKPPREIANSISNLLSADPWFEKVEVAGPGFINLTLQPEFVSAFVENVVKNPQGFFKLTPATPKKINIEFVSVNPNGPITIGSGRGAAYGSTLCNVLETAGNQIHREYYVNDGTSSEQMRLFAESVKAILNDQPVPDNGYRGDYVFDVANTLRDQGMSGDLAEIKIASEKLMIERQREAMELMGVKYDTWFHEQSLHNSGEVEEDVDALIAKGAADTKPVRNTLKLARGGVVEDVLREAQTGAVDDEGQRIEGEGSSTETLWLRSTKFGDDMDRVLRRQDGRFTYIASDVAYHKNKFSRPENADLLITILGPDHHGYIGRLTAVVAAMMAPDKPVEAPDSPELSDIEAKIFASKAERDSCNSALKEAQKKLTVQIYQLVRFLKDGKPAPMRKRDGNIYALIDLINEIGEKSNPNGTTEEKQRIGKDVTRFFYLMRHHDTTFDFDLDLAEKQSDDNPVFYVQYAHARICSVLTKAREAGINEDGDTALLTHPKEKELILAICDLPNEIQRSAEDYAVNRLANYSIELARKYHAFYDQCRVVDEGNPQLSAARAKLCRAAQITLQATLNLLGVSAPERMERTAVPGN